jgi:hypothetical protein
VLQPALDAVDELREIGDRVLGSDPHLPEPRERALVRVLGVRFGKGLLEHRPDVLQLVRDAVERAAPGVEEPGEPGVRHGWTEPRRASVAPSRGSPG